MRHVNLDADLALVSVPGLDALPLDLYQDELRAGSECYAVGSPLGLEQSVSKGVVSNPSRVSGGVRYIQVDAPLNPGNSGGPIIDVTGQVIGIVTLKPSDTEGLGFGVAYTEIADFLREVREGLWAANTTSSTELPEPEFRAISEAIAYSGIAGEHAPDILSYKRFGGWAFVVLDAATASEKQLGVVLVFVEGTWAVLESGIMFPRSRIVSYGAPQELLDHMGAMGY